jgi:heme/copper-type cytochrome/quinol oxidase subunit 4
MAIPNHSDLRLSLSLSLSLLCKTSFVYMQDGGCHGSRLTAIIVTVIVVVQQEFICLHAKRRLPWQQINTCHCHGHCPTRVHYSFVYMEDGGCHGSRLTPVIVTVIVMVIVQQESIIHFVYMQDGGCHGSRQQDKRHLPLKEEPAIVCVAVESTQELITQYEHS